MQLHSSSHLGQSLMARMSSEAPPPQYLLIMMDKWTQIDFSVERES